MAARKTPPRRARISTGSTATATAALEDAAAEDAEAEEAMAVEDDEAMAEDAEVVREANGLLEYSSARSSCQHPHHSKQTSERTRKKVECEK
jgi:hypothetical protein